jgi:hypothetical protein
VLGASLLGRSVLANGKPGVAQQIASRSLQDDKAECSLWEELVDYARWSPSPHNIQPWKLKIVSDLQAELLYDTSRLLPATDPSSRFTIAGLSMFITCLDVAAASMGYTIHTEHENEPVLNDATTGLRTFARLSLVKRLQPPTVDCKLILKRRTSRLHYDKRPVSIDVVNRMSAIAARYGFTMNNSTSTQLIRTVLDLNRETLFHDLDVEAARKEISKWIRTTDEEASTTKDGLWSRCMRFRGSLMRNFFFHPERFHAPWKRKVLGNVYKNSMQGTRHIAWISGSFANRADWLRGGEMLQYLWMDITRDNVYMHPFGSVITNENAHRRFESVVSHDPAKGELWLLFRMGYSDEPPRSFRLETKDIIIKKA